MSSVPEALPPEFTAKMCRCSANGGAVLLLGDSMIARFQDYGTGRGLLDPNVFDNYGIGGSTTNHWMHLLETGQIQFKSQYKTIILMVGTNNLAKVHESADEIAQGILNVCRLLLCRFPQAKLYFVSILPRWDLARWNILEDIATINQTVSKHFAVLSPPLNDRTLFAHDLLHLNREGYIRFAQSLLNIRY